MTAAEMRDSVRQRGSTMILSIMVMMGLGLIALNSLQQQLSAGLALTSNQHRYVIAWENAASALAWGIASHGKTAANLSGSAGMWQQASSLQAPAECVSGLHCARIFSCFVAKEEWQKAMNLLCNISRSV